MSKVAIVTDSNSGITQSEAKEYGVTVMPMPFFINDQTPGDRFRLHRRGTPDHRGGGPRGGLPPVCRRVRRITDKPFKIRKI